MSLTKAHIAKTIHNRLGFTNVRSAQVIDSFLTKLPRPGPVRAGKAVLR